jgi:hypothetical protein
MKKLILSILIVTTLSSIHAQNIKNEKVGIKYLRLPASPLKTELKTYRKTIELISLKIGDSRPRLTSEISTSLNLAGYSEVQEGADMELYARLEEYSAEGLFVNSEERTETKSDKTTVKYYVYTGVCEMKYPLYFRFRDIKADKIIYEGYVNNSDRYVKKRTSEYRTQAAAEAELEQLVAGGKRDLFDVHRSALYTKVASDYSFSPLTFNWSINYVETSKKANYDNVVAAKEATKTALESLSNKSHEVSIESETLILKAIDMWQSILKESNLDDKKARIDKKVTMAVLENIAYCYFFIQNFSEADKFMLQAMNVDKKSWQLELKDMITNTKKRFKANNVEFR